MLKFKKTNLLHLILIVVSIFACLDSATVFAANTYTHKLHHKHFRHVAYRSAHRVHYARRAAPLATAAKKDDVQFTIEPNNVVVAENVAIPEDAAAPSVTSLTTEIPLASTDQMPESVSASVDVVDDRGAAVVVKSEELSTQAVKPSPLDLADALGLPKREEPADDSAKFRSEKIVRAQELATPSVRTTPINLAAILNKSNTTAASQQATGPQIVVAKASTESSLTARLFASLRQLTKKPESNTEASASTNAPAPTVPAQPMNRHFVGFAAAKPQAVSTGSSYAGHFNKVSDPNTHTTTATVPAYINKPSQPIPARNNIHHDALSATTTVSTNVHINDTVTASSAVASAPSLPARLFASLRQFSKRKPEATMAETPPSAQPSYVDKKSMFGNIAASMHRHLVDFIQKTVSTLRYSNYKLGGSKFDTTRGVYITDCSGFVDNILRKASPHAYSSLVNATGAPTPATQHYYTFFQELSENSDNSYWNKVTEVDQLRAGDILVFRYKNSRGMQTGGHVMVVMEKPIRDTNVYFVRVADSAPSRHSEDTRPIHEGGIGIGTLLLKASKSGRPAAYAWGIGGLWNKNVNFAMARPTDWD